jgi:hypothetical protein
MIRAFFDATMIDPRALFGAFMGYLCYLAFQPHLRILASLGQLVVSLTAGTAGADYAMYQLPALKTMYAAGALLGFIGNVLGGVLLSLAPSWLPGALGGKLK